MLLVALLFLGLTDLALATCNCCVEMIPENFEGTDCLLYCIHNPCEFHMRQSSVAGVPLLYFYAAMATVAMAGALFLLTKRGAKKAQSPLKDATPKYGLV